MGSCNLLLVDDDENIRITLSKILAKKGYEITTAKSGFQALQLLKDKKFEFILMDIRMSGMDGVETFKIIRSLNPEIPVILMTAFSVEERIEEAYQAQVYAVIKKPFEIETIVQTLENARLGNRIVILDNDLNFCKSVKNALESKGYSTSVCATAPEALALAREKHHRLFLIDMKLPVSNGLEVHYKLKEIDPWIETVLITAYRDEMEGLIAQAMESGARGCLYKPFEIEDALKLIREILDKK